MKTINDLKTMMSEPSSKEWFGKWGRKEDENTTIEVNGQQLGLLLERISEVANDDGVPGTTRAVAGSLLAKLIAASEE